MELPFSSFELTFIVAAFVIVSLFGLASVCIRPHGDLPGTEPPVARHRLASDPLIRANPLSEKGVYEAQTSRLLKKKQGVISKQAGQKP